MSLNNLLCLHNVGKKGGECTHTRIPDDSLGIFPGKYFFGEKESEFYEKLYNHLFVNLFKEYLTEKQRENGTLVVDFDFRYNSNVTTRQHNANDIFNIVLIFLEEIKNLVEIVQPFTVYVMEKTKVNVLPEKTKDGIHFVFSFDLERSAHIQLRERVVQKLQKNDVVKLPLINSWEDVYDQGISKGHTNWMIFGCRKPAHDAYDITYQYHCDFNPCNREFTIKSIVVEKLLSLDTFKALSVRTPKQLFKLLNPIVDTVVTKDKKKNSREGQSETNYCFLSCKDDKYVDLLFNVIGNGEHIDYQKWLYIASILKSNGYDFEVLEKYTNLYDPDNPKTSLQWIGIKEKFPIFGLQTLAKEINPEMYKKWLKKYKEIDAIICNDEKTASEYIYNLVKDKLVSYKGRLFYKLDNIWLNDEQKINDAMLMFIMNSNIYTGTIEKKISFAQNVTKARKIQEALFCKIRLDNEDTRIYDKFHSSTKGGICFNDGFLDFKNNQFQRWETIEHDAIYTTIKINRNFEDYFNEPNLEVVKEIETKIFEPLYGKDMQPALQFLSRAIAGHNEDKRWATYLGNRDCGKGVEYALLASAFGPYVSQFELGNILYTRYTSGFENLDASKKLYWLLDYEHVRLAVSQEIPDPSKGDKANAKILKKMSGGGDTFVARRNYDRKDTSFIIDTTFYIKGNNSLVCDSEDCKENCLEFSSFVQFKSNEEIDHMRENCSDLRLLDKYRVADPEIKRRCESTDWANAMVYLLFKNYKPNAVTIKREFDSDDKNCYVSNINNNFNFTYDLTDHVACNIVFDTINDCDKGKVTLDLSSMNIHKKKCRKRDCICYNKWCFYGIKGKK